MGKESKKSFGYSVQRDKLYSTYFYAINGILGLTKKEIKIVSRFYYYLEEISKGVTDPVIQNELLFSVNYKRKIREDLEVSALLLNNYVKTLKDKGVIMEKDGIKSMNPVLRLDITADSVNISIVLQVTDG
jgi:hypothetical protein